MGLPAVQMRSAVSRCESWTFCAQGEAWPTELASGEALEIMTGAPVPLGADCVVMVEHTSTTGPENSEVRLLDGRRVQTGRTLFAGQ